MFRGGKTAAHEKDYHQQQTVIKTPPKTFSQPQYLRRGHSLDTSAKEPITKQKISSST